MPHTTSKASATTTGKLDPQSSWQLGHKFRHLVKADGKRVYIASNPVEAEELRRNLPGNDKDAEFVIHGSDEHLHALRHIHSLHQQKRDAFQKRHGDHFTELESAIRDMEEVRQELHGLEKRVRQLDAAAEKYGYDSHVRLQTQTGDSTPTGSQQPSDFEDRRTAISMSFFTKPALRQYYHKGLLWRANAIHEAGPYELFVDLVYVGVIAIAGDAAAAHANGHSILRFAVTFLIAWKFRTEINVYMGWFVQEDIARRLAVIFVLVCLVGATINMEGFYAETYTALVAFYVAAGFMSAFSWLAYAFWLPMIRGVLLSNAAFLFVSMPLWIGSIHSHRSGRYILIWIGLFLDIIGDELKWVFIFYAQEKAWVDCIPAVSVEHMVSRYDAFVTLVLGYSVVSLLYQSASSNPMNNFFTKAVLGLLQAFALNSLYFEMDSFNLFTHAVRRHNRLLIGIWKLAHIPFLMSFVAAGATISRLVLAHDCANCPVEALGESYTAKSQASISQGQRWFYCAGLGISVVCTVIIASTHVYREPVGDWVFRHSKNIRLGLRAVVGVVIVLLPIAGEKLDSVSLIATTAGLLHFCLFVDLGGNILYTRFCPTAKLPSKINTRSVQPH